MIGPHIAGGLQPGFFFLSYKKKGEDEDEGQLAILFFPLVAGAPLGFFAALRRGPAELPALQRVSRGSTVSSA